MSWYEAKIFTNQQATYDVKSLKKERESDYMPGLLFGMESPEYSSTKKTYN